MSAAVLKKAESDKKAVEDKLAKEEVAREKAKKRVEEALMNKEEELEAEKKRSADLEASWAPTTEESDDISVLKSRAEMAEAGFDRAVEQLKLLNPGLKVDNIGLSSRIVDGQLLPDSPAEDE
ncbi:uncharacterized protein LOC131621972 [Vicia villosa]|uniref:uncharacterized protein LOC131621972 n=1 Tax=Vicia villosa TaxID=3911 RepID=UPI00273CB221|nr:uncharacterized protein LOC131621972 [Vicia villosa]